MAPSSSSPRNYDDKPRDWSELPPELTFSILCRLGVVEILENAQKVCTTWRRVSKDLLMWRKIDLRKLEIPLTMSDFHIQNICRRAVDRSQGGLVEISFGSLASDSLLTYIADRSSILRSLELEIHYGISNEILMNTLAKLSSLEELEISHSVLKLDLRAIGHSCPQLKTLKLNVTSYMRCWFQCDDDDALAIAESMPELRHLQLLGDRITNSGLKAILDNCPHLNHLDLRQCLNINLSKDLEKQCLERVKNLRCPNDSTADCPFVVAFVDFDSEDYMDLDLDFDNHYDFDFDFDFGYDYCIYEL